MLLLIPRVGFGYTAGVAVAVDISVGGVGVVSAVGAIANTGVGSGGIVVVVFCVVVCVSVIDDIVR